MVNPFFELEQNVEEPKVAVDDKYSLNMDVVQLDNREVQLPSHSRRAKAIIAFALLAVLLAFTFYATYKPKPKKTLLEEFEEKLAKFREFVKEKEEKKELTQGQKVALEKIENKFNEFKEGKFTQHFFFFEERIKECLREFFVEGLKDGDNFRAEDDKFDSLFEEGFFSVVNRSYSTKYLFDTGGNFYYDGDRTDPKTPRIIVKGKKM